ncbi:hypothetical protein KSP40_PGU004777 [Platanthera guangdongensis]|uniref:Reverse transcriptase domain-containing protein n=1 Tax=Platanthera guangdongensis TaxID=2320717 RepID=A0ABR2LEL9_9ASPA
MIATAKCELELFIDGKAFDMPATVLNMPEFDIILGMAWLNWHFARIDCAEKKIYLRHGDTEVIFQGINFAPRMLLS